MEELSEQPEDSILLDEIKKMNSGLASNKEQPEITEEDLEANPQAYSSEQIEGVLRNKRSIRTKLDDYLRMSSSLLPTTPREALDAVGTLREELQANGDASGVMQLASDLEIVLGISRTIQDDWTIHSAYPPTDGNQIGVVNADMSYNGLPSYGEVTANRSRYQFISANFYGDLSYDSIYGVNGVDRARLS